MRLLLDTHVWLWVLAEPERIAERTRDAIETAAELILSVRNQGIAFITFADQPSAEDALARLNRATLQGRPCRVEWARQQKKS